MVNVILEGPDQVWSNVTVAADATVRDVATSQYDLFWRNLKKNGQVVPFSAGVEEGDLVTVQDLPLRNELTAEMDSL